MLDESPRPLSDREMEVLRLMATGASNQQIAHDLAISVNTVKVHIRNIFEKLSVASRTEATLYAIQAGWVQVGSTSASDQVPDASLPYPAEPDQVIHRSRTRRWLLLAGAPLVALLAVVVWFVAVAPSPVSSVPPTRSTNVSPAPARIRTRSPMLSPRAGLASVVYNLQVYAIGGETAAGLTGAVERYDPRADQWIPRASKPTPVRGVGAAVVRGKIYVPGGCTAGDVALNILEIYDPVDNTWTTGPNLPAPICEYAIASQEGQVYIFGGRDGTAYKANAYSFDPREGRWSALPAMPTARARAAAAVNDGRIFVVGGTNGTELATNEVFTPGKEAWAAWEKAASLPQSRAGHGLVAIGNSLYAVGGEHQAQSLGIAQYDVTTDTWTQLDFGGVELPGNAGVVELDASKILVLGGWTDKSITTEFTVRYQIFLP